MVETVMCDKSLFSASYYKKKRDRERERERERRRGGPNWTNAESQVMKINNRKFIANNTEIRKNLGQKYL